MRSLCVIIVGLSGSLLHGTPVVNGVGNAASGGLDISPGSLISIYGTDLAATAVIAGRGKLPTTLGETSVSIAGIAAPLTYVSPTQINAQVPFEAAPGPTTLTVTTAQGASTPFPLSNVLSTSPGVFRSNTPGQALIITPAFHVANTIRSGDIIIFYATGLGQTNPPMATGAVGASAEPLNRLPSFPAVWIGGNPAKVLFAGMAPGLSVYQINVKVPNLPSNDQIVLSTATDNYDVSGVAFANSNVSNVNASVNLIFPSASSHLLFSPMLMAATYSLTMDVSATGRPFQINVEIDGSNAVSTFTVNPTAGTLSGVSTVPTSATRFGDFSSSGLTTLDFRTGSLTQDFTPFPNNVIPLSLMDPAALNALSSLPSGAAPGSDGSIVTYSFSGTFVPGPSFSFASTAPGAQFGGFMTATFHNVAPPTITVGATMFVDGVRAATTSVTAPTTF